MSERRTVPRYDADLPAKLTPTAGGAAIDVKVTNLSITGCSLEGAVSLKPNEDCELKIEWESLEFHAEASVAWKSSKGEAGLRFLYVDQQNQQTLRTICSNLRLQPLTTRSQDPA